MEKKENLREPGYIMSTVLTKPLHVPVSLKCTWTAVVRSQKPFMSILCLPAAAHAGRSKMATCVHRHENTSGACMWKLKVTQAVVIAHF